MQPVASQAVQHRTARPAAGGDPPLRAAATRAATPHPIDWRRINADLAELIGIQGVRAVHARCATLAAARQKAPASEAGRSRAAQQTWPGSGATTAADDAALAIFRDVLASLMGPLLTQRLLASPHQDRLPPRPTEGDR